MTERRHRGFVIEQVCGPFQDDRGAVFRFGGWRAACPRCGATLGGVYQSDLREHINAHCGERSRFIGHRCALREAAK